jgi:hypothetical protein
MTHKWYGNDDDLLDLAIRLALSDGATLPSRDELKPRSFLGTDHYWIKNSADIPLFRIRVSRLRSHIINASARIDRDPGAHQTTNDDAPFHESSNDRMMTEKDEEKILYKLKTKGFLVSTQLMKLCQKQKEAAIHYILAMNHKLDNDLICEILIQDGDDEYSEHCMLTLVKTVPPREAAEFLASKTINSFYIDEQELLYLSEEHAKEAQHGFLEILRLLDVTNNSCGSHCLKLDIEDPLSTEWSTEMSEWLDVYASFFPVTIKLR